MKKSREAARVAAQGSIGRKAIGAQWLVVVTSASLISLFVVMPYTFGYFYFVDLAFMPFFSIADYYLFSVLPLLSAVLLFGVQYFLSHQSVRFVRYVLSRLRPAWRRNYRVRTGLSALILVLALSLFVFAAAHLAVGLIAVLCVLVILALLIYFSVAKGWTSRTFYILVFVFSELFLISWGYVVASNAIDMPRLVNVTPQNGEKDIIGHLFFAGGQGVLLVNEEGPLFVHLDGGTKFRGGTVTRNDYLGGCLTNGLAQRIRQRTGIECIGYASLSIWRKQESSQRAVKHEPMKTDSR